ncbi:MAG: hypothetical protein AseanaTS_02140 [Candidatus Pelagadaptatus aseana]|uniref:hypothetical protein n=1 Tax=Candidatus Pelagadaptatus aseana TaxID=3120508 RepID=UPI0039B30EAF
MLTNPLNETAVVISMLCSGVFFMTGLLTGAWKYFAMVASENYKAPYYVDVAHRASLMYAFAAMLLAVFAYFSAFSDTTNTIAAVFPLLFFAISIALYIVLGIKNETNNQLRDAEDKSATAKAMYVLMFAEIGGFAVLFAGFIASIL